MSLKMTEQQLIDKIKELPDNLKQEVLNYAGYLAEKYSTKQLAKPIPRFGSAKGKYVLAEDFDAPLNDFKEYM
jgi:hypothetical protein